MEDDSSHLLKIRLAELKAAFDAPTPILSAAPAADPPDLWQICQQAPYPITFEWPGGEYTTYHNTDEAYQDLWARAMLREAQALGGVVATTASEAI